MIAIEGKSHRELIDTLWNVNSTRLLPLYLLLYELIDTLWNVNIDFICYEQFYICELIDTLWNVNIDSCLDCGYQGEN